MQALISVLKVLLRLDGLYKHVAGTELMRYYIILNVFALLKMISSNLLNCSGLDENFVPEMADDVFSYNENVIR